MRKLFKILTLSLMGIFLIACSTHKSISLDNNVLGASMKYELFVQNGSVYQVDSLINADDLPLLNKWISSTFIDYNTQEMITKRVYVRQHSKNDEIVYIITGNKEPYEIIKRSKR